MKYPAIALLEFAHIPAGIHAGDAMVKKAPITVLRSGTVHNGKYIVLIGGSVAAVEESYREGLACGKGHILDELFLPDVHPEVHAAILGTRQAIEMESLAVIETETLSAVVKAADKSLKGTDIRLVELRLGDDIGGKGLAIFNGRLEAVSAAIELARSVIDPPSLWLNETLIPRLSEEMLGQIEHSTSFKTASLRQLPGGEI